MTFFWGAPAGKSVTHDAARTALAPAMRQFGAHGWTAHAVARIVAAGRP